MREGSINRYGAQLRLFMVTLLWRRGGGWRRARRRPRSGQTALFINLAGTIAQRIGRPARRARFVEQSLQVVALLRKDCVDILIVEDHAIERVAEDLVDFLAALAKANG